jgi:hypothetical protein
MYEIVRNFSLSPAPPSPPSSAAAAFKRAASKEGLITPPPPHHFPDRILFITSQPVASLSFQTTFRAHQIFLMASGIDWAVTFLYVPIDIFLPVQLLCFIYALMTLLQRVSDHASHSYYNVARDRNRRTGTTGKKFDWRD